MLHTRARMTSCATRRPHPEDTRNFVRLLIPLGLFNDRAFIFPVHFTK